MSQKNFHHFLMMYTQSFYPSLMRVIAVGIGDITLVLSLDVNIEIFRHRHFMNTNCIIQDIELTNQNNIFP